MTREEGGTATGQGEGCLTKRGRNRQNEQKKLKYRETKTGQKKELFDKKDKKRKKYMDGKGPPLDRGKG